ncbi:MAG: carbohydrate ABC transporter permease [Lachnospiraceae bacterium]|nr:carbohydrate ABC transporter permease [Lachnospiraceae bacterium]
MTDRNGRLHFQRMARRTVNKTCCYILLVLVGVLCAGPFAWLLSTSFKSNENIYALRLLPQNPSIDAYVNVFKLLNIGRMLVNSVIIAGGGVLLNLILGALCAYPLAKMDFYGKKLINTLLLATMIIPAAAGLVVNYITIQNLHLNGSYWGVILPNSVNVFSIIMLRQAYLAVPKELLDSARIDGAGELRVWWAILLPQIRPSMLTVVIMDFINKWNMFLWPLLILNVDQYPVATGMQYISQSFEYKFVNVAAGTVLSVLPVIILFVIFQKQYVNNTAGAMKG